MDSCNQMEFGYEERSKRLIERLDRIQNYLLSLPPLPNIESVKRTESQSQDSTEIGVHSAGSQTGDEITDCAQSSSAEQSVSTRLSKAVPKDEFTSERLLQSASPGGSPVLSPVLSPDVSKGTGGGPSPELSRTEHVKTRQKRNRRKDNRIQDPLKPTTRISFGIDIGQGINVINYIKQNAVPGLDPKNRRLAGIIAKGVASDKSLDKQISSARVSSVGSNQLRNKDSDAFRSKSSGRHRQMDFKSTASLNTSDTDIYRVRYQERATELPHHHGLDTLQELFVPYTEHDYVHEPMSQNPSEFE